MKRTPILLAAAAAVVFLGVGCGKKASPPTPAPTNAPEAPAKAPGLPRETSEQLDENDNLDQALKELEAVE